MSPVNLPDASEAVKRRIEYWQAFAEALREHNHANRARVNGKPELVGYFARNGIEQLHYARALRTGDWSLTRMRPLWWFAAQAKRVA